MEKLIVPITPDPVTSNPREAEVIFSNTINWDFNVKVFIYEKNQEGVRLFDVARDLTGQQKEATMAKHSPIIREYTTFQSFVNAQGQVVAHDAEGAIPETDFLAALTIEQVMGLLGKTLQDSFVETVKGLIGYQVQQISARGQN